MNDFDALIGLPTNFFTGPAPVLEIVGFTLQRSTRTELEITRARSLLLSLPDAYELHLDGDKFGLDAWRLDPDNHYADPALQAKADAASRALSGRVPAGNLERVDHGLLKLCIGRTDLWATYIEHGQIVESVTLPDGR